MKTYYPPIMKLIILQTDDFVRTSVEADEDFVDTIGRIPNGWKGVEG